MVSSAVAAELPSQPDVAPERGVQSITSGLVGGETKKMLASLHQTLLGYG